MFPSIPTSSAGASGSAAGLPWKTIEHIIVIMVIAGLTALAG